MLESAKNRKHYEKRHRADDNSHSSNAVNNVDCIIFTGAFQVTSGYVKRKIQGFKISCGVRAGRGFQSDFLSGSVLCRSFQYNPKNRQYKK